MKFLRPVLFPLLLSFCQTTTAQQLEDYRWKNRILLLCDKAAGSTALQLQLKTFLTEDKGLADRDLLIFLVTEDGTYNSTGKPIEMGAQEIRKELKIPSIFKGTLLIGKDGGVKMREEFQVDPEAVFTLIDGMPMRRAEMQRSRKL